MKVMRILAVVVVVMAPGIAARGSQNRIMPITEVRLSSTGVEHSGPVVVAVTMDGEKWKSLTIEAFGKTHSLTEKQLETLQDFPVNSLKLQYGDYAIDDRNPREKAVHVVASISTTVASQDGRDAGLAVTIMETTTATITVTANGNVEVGKTVTQVKSRGVIVPS